MSDYPRLDETGLAHLVDELAEKIKANENVQSDWDISDSNSDAFIKNKPSIFNPDNLSSSSNTPTDSETLITKEGGSWVTKTFSKGWDYTKGKIGISASGSTEKYLNEQGAFAKIPALDESPSAKTVDYAPIISVSDALAVNAKDIKAKIDPIQDLHGYDKPWVGGAGKNLLPLTVDGIKAANTDGTWSGNVCTINGVSFTILTDNGGNVTGIKTNGTANSKAELFLIKNDGSLLENWVGYTLNGCPSNGGVSTYKLSAWGGGGSTEDTGNGTTIRSSTYLNVNLNVYTGTNVDNLVWYPMVRQSTESNPTFEPYSNICPITGWDEVNVTRAQISANFEQGGLVDRTGELLNFQTRIRTDFINIPEKATYLQGINLVAGYEADIAARGYYFYDANKSFVSYIHVTDNVALPNNDVATIPSNAKYFRIVLQRLDASLNVSPVGKRVVINLNTYTISLNGTRYGGTLDVTTGELTLTHKYSALPTTFDVNAVHNDIWILSAFIGDTSAVSVQNTDTQIRVKSNIFEGVSANKDIQSKPYYSLALISNRRYYLIIPKSDYATLADVNAMIGDNNGEVVYEITPQTIQLTPQEIQLLQGNNNLFSDTGDTQLTYYNSTIGNIGEVVGKLEGDKANKSDLTSINVTGTTNNTGSAISSGTYFYLNGTLVKAKVDIASGATFTKNTNYEEVTAGALNKLNDALVTVETNYQSVKLMHNIPRLEPKDITSYISDGTFWKRLNGTDGYELFEDIYVGDYWEMTEAISAYNQNSQYQATGSKYVTIAGIDMHYGDGDGGDSVSAITYHHVDVVAGQGFGGTQHFGRSRMNSSNTTTGGYVGSEMHTTTIGAVTTTGKRASTDATATINEQLYAEFGSHLKTQRCLLSNAMESARYNRFGQAGGASSGWAWASVQAVLMTEIECYGSIVWSSSGYDTGNGNKQLPLFAHSKQAMNNRNVYYWLRDVASSTNFCLCDYVGVTYCDFANRPTYYVRPRFILA